MALLFYGGTIGGIFGALIVALALNRSHNDFMRLLNHYWQNDILSLKKQIATKLSTKSGDN